MSKSKWIVTIVSVISLTACSTIQRYRVPPPGLIDDTVAPVRVLYGRNDRKDARTIAAAFLKSYDAAYDASSRTATVSPAQLANRDVAALEMTRLGMTVIEVRCDAFFESIGRGSQRLSFFRRQIEILSTALTTALGLASASDTVVAAAGIGSGATLSTMANYETTFFFSPDIGKVQHLVDDALEAMRLGLLAPNIAPRDFESAIRALKKYQTVCTAHEIKRLVNEAVDSRKSSAGSSGVGIDPLAVASDTIMRGLAGDLKAPVQVRDLALMKWIVDGPPSSDELDFICPSFTSADLRSRVCQGDLGKRSVTHIFHNDVPRVSKAIAAIDQLQPSLLDTTLETWKAAEVSASGPIKAARSAAASSVANSRAEADAKVRAIQAALDAAQRVDVTAPASTIGQTQPNVAVVPSPSP